MVGRSNPRAKEWCFARRDCAPCLGRGLLAAEAEEELLRLAEVWQDGKVEGQPIPKRKAEDRMSIPTCTMEGVNYTLEC